MAVQIEKPTRPVNEVLRRFADEMVASLRANFETQKIWPTEVYPGYAAINEQRAKLGKWASTGEGYKSFSTEVHSNPGLEAIIIRFNEYLRYVDMGVGAGTHYGKVDKESKARYNKRYIDRWDRKEGESHRPAIMMEARHLEARMQNYFEDFYGREVQTSIIQSIEGLIPLNLFS